MAKQIHAEAPHMTAVAGQGGKKKKTKVGRLVDTALRADETVDHVDRSLDSFDVALAEFNKTLARFADVLERFGDTVARVDSTVDRIGVITDEMGEIVGQMGDMVQTFSPAFTLNDRFRQQLDRIRRLGPGGGGAHAAEADGDE
jgi:uncharacterized protein YukE